jgi:NAD(P)-dependent dehydrogenase (short-subunit alcohol dehydrogenase family)
MDFGLKGKIAIVTGAAGGIGGAVARDFAREGVNLSLPYHRKACTDLIEEIKGFGIETMTVHADVCNANDIEALVRATYDRFGAIDILVNNAGAGLLGSVEDTTEEDWDRMMALNLKSVFLLSKAVLKHMKQQRWGRIINIGSVLAKTATNARPWIDPQGSAKTGGGAYAASKAGVHTLTRALAKETAAYGITVNCVAPGPTRTAQVPGLSEPVRDQLPVGRIGEPEEISAFVVLLASQRGGYVTGEIMDVNGGLWMD